MPYTKEQRKAHYQRNKEKYLENQRKSRERTRKILDEIRCSGCTVCGYNEHPSCLEYHHLDPATKEVNICSIAMKNKWGRERIMKEVEKCVLVCANCHRLIHAGVIVIE